MTSVVCTDMARVVAVEVVVLLFANFLGHGSGLPMILTIGTGAAGLGSV
eukprot:CAMPEP_0172670482 /NCGR_PEP_ID=MMETSP1074-20121228/10332_1 /TAXON_ID=2916 /ORGANISM="Ceratium fusus, Strain PA161109" /LENGTH=48 /DNA_ID= /DNA_START= /DNA_END= /DNA_ORIENTATION=